MNLADCYRLLGLRTGASYEDIKASYRRLARQYHPDANPGHPQEAKEKFIQLTDAYQQLMNAAPPQRRSDSPQSPWHRSPRAPVQPTPGSGNPPGSANPPVQTPSAKPAPGHPLEQPQDQPQSREASPDSRQTPAASPDPSAKLDELLNPTNPAPANPVNPANPDPDDAANPVNPANPFESDRQLKQRIYVQLQLLLKELRFPRAVTLVEGLAQRLPNDGEVRQWQAITYQRFGRHLINLGESGRARLYLQKALRTDPRNRALWFEVERDLSRIDRVEEIF